MIMMAANLYPVSRQFVLPWIDVSHGIRSTASVGCQKADKLVRFNNSRRHAINIVGMTKTGFTKLL